MSAILCQPTWILARADFDTQSAELRAQSSGDRAVAEISVAAGDHRRDHPADGDRVGLVYLSLGGYLLRFAGAAYSAGHPRRISYFYLLPAHGAFSGKARPLVPFRVCADCRGDAVCELSLRAEIPDVLRSAARADTTGGAAALIGSASSASFRFQRFARGWARPRPESRELQGRPGPRIGWPRGARSHRRSPAPTAAHRGESARPPGPG